MTTYTNNVLNQVTAVNGRPIAYDRNGSRTQDARFKYQYNYRGQLARATRSLSNRRDYTMSFQYDVLGRRVSRQIAITQRPRDARSPSSDTGGDEPDDDLPASGFTRFIYDGHRLIEEQDAQGRTLRTYVHGAGLSAPISMDVMRPDRNNGRDDDRDRNCGHNHGRDRDRDCGHRHNRDHDNYCTPNRDTARRDRYFFHANRLGSVTHVTDLRGDVVESYRYDAYGVPSFEHQRRYDPPFRPRAAFTSSIGNPFLFAGQRYEEGLRLYDLRARDYDPTLGKFLQRDPIGTAGGMNLYAYCRNNPVNFADPLGLSRSSVPTWLKKGAGYLNLGVGLWGLKALGAEVALVAAEGLAVAGYLGAAIAGGGVLAFGLAAGYIVSTTLSAGGEATAMHLGANQATAKDVGEVTLAAGSLALAYAASKSGGTEPPGERPVQSPKQSLEFEAASTGNVEALVETPGTATIRQFKGSPYHFTVEIASEVGILETHQMTSSVSGESTYVVTAAQVNPGTYLGKGTIPVPQAELGLALQQQLLATPELGPYDRVTNSCVTHICDILSAAGVDVPAPNGRTQLRFLLSLIQTTEP